MTREEAPVQIRDADVFVLIAGALPPTEDSGPYEALRRIFGRAHLRLLPHDGPDCRTRRQPCIAEEQNRGRAVEGNVCMSGVYDQGEVKAGQNLLHERLAERALHEVVRGDQPDEARRRYELQTPLDKRGREGVLPRSRYIAPAATDLLAMIVLSRFISFEDVRRIRHNRMEAAFKNLTKRGSNLGTR